MIGKEAADRNLGAHRLGFRRGVLFGGQTVGGFNSVAASSLCGIERLVSLGIESDGPNDTAEEIVRRADMAMFYVKRSKKGPMVRDAAE